jgi:3'(2'), 5'-bisphosphate nucleotidase
MSSLISKEELLAIALEGAKQAGVEVINYYQHGNFSAEVKEDDSPVTCADIAANDILMTHLQKMTPDIPIMSEEVGTVPLEQRKHWSKYWLLDPIDGTGEFILASGDFAVNIALIEDGHPTIGVIYAPDKNTVYYGQKGLGAFKDDGQSITQLKVATYDESIRGRSRAIKVAVSRRQHHELMGQYLNKDDYHFEYVPLGSCSLKNCIIAEGLADCYLRMGPTGEWDTGASQCILEQAGGFIVSSEYLPLTYNKRESVMNPDFFSLGNKNIAWRDVIRAHKTLRDY